MNIADVQKRLLAAARATPPGDAVPFAFEKRIMARIASDALVDAWAIWSWVLWRAAAPCIAIMLAVGVWTALFADPNGSANSLAADLEETVLAPLAQLENNSW
jgi:hypothetical protein